MKKDQETAQMLNKLRVYHVALERQNEKLRRARHELRVSRTRYFDLYNQAPVGYCTIDGQGVILETNLTAANQLGVAQGVLIKQSLVRFIHPDDHDIATQHRKQLFATGSPQSSELRILCPDGTTLWAQLEGNLTHGTNGLPVCRIVLNDITSRKQMEKTLRKSEEKYRTVADFNYDWEFWLGPDLDSKTKCIFQQK